MSTSPTSTGPRFATLLDALNAAPARRTFITMCFGEGESESVTFGELRQRAAAHARIFRDRGLGTGDRVVIIMPQGIEQMAAFVGAMMLGAVPAFLAYPNFKVDPAKHRSGLAGVCANIGARLIVIDCDFPEDLLAHVDLGRDSALVRAASAEHGPSIDLPTTPVSPDALAFIQHSAGTTGLQKGVALSHAAVLLQLHQLAVALRLGPHDRVYSWLPLYHDMGLIACFMLPLVYHLPIVMQSPTDWVMQPGSMLQLIGEHRCTLAWVPNFTLQFLARRVHEDDRADFDLSSLRALINCSEPVRAQSIDEFVAAYADNGLGAHVLHSSYAMAENVFAVTQSPVDGRSGPRRMWVDGPQLRARHVAEEVDRDRAGALEVVSSGRGLPGHELQIVNDGMKLPDGCVGEIHVRSACLFDGYFHRPDLTAMALVDGWYRTGDLGFQHAGELFVIGRKKDLIIVAGKNIYPQDVEEIVCAHDAIHDGRAVAIGVLDAELGTEDIVVVAEVEDAARLDDAVAIERALKAAIVAELGVAARAIYLKPPRWIVKSTAGKPARSTTRDKLIAEHPELAPESDGDAR